MQKNNSRAISTKSFLVEILLLDGSALSGRMWVPVQSRLTDMLNDGRDFLPLESREGALLAVAKSAIKHIVIPRSEAESYRGSNPYTILGVGEGASQEELKRAYYRLCASNHPDRIKGLGLGPEYEELATQNMMRINAAYAEVQKAAGIRE